MSTVGLLGQCPTLPLLFCFCSSSRRGGGYLQTQLDILHQKLFRLRLVYIFSAEATVSGRANPIALNLFIYLFSVFCVVQFLAFALFRPNLANFAKIKLAAGKVILYIFELFSFIFNSWTWLTGDCLPNLCPFGWHFNMHFALISQLTRRIIKINILSGCRPLHPTAKIININERSPQYLYLGFCLRWAVYCYWTDSLLVHEFLARDCGAKSFRPHHPPPGDTHFWFWWLGEMRLCVNAN